MIVVGGGTTGAALAARLTEDPSRRVLLVEAGPDDAAYPDLVRDPQREYDLLLSGELTVADGAIVGHATSPTMLLRGEVLGGTSAVNFLATVRGAPADYDGWAAAGCAGWAWADVRGAFRRAEHDLDHSGSPDHGDRGPLTVRRWPESTWSRVHQAVRDGTAELGVRWVADLNDPEVPWGVGTFPAAVQPSGARLTTSQAYLTAEVRARPNLSIRTRTAVARLVLGDGRCTGVELADGSTLRAHAVVVCGGALPSPALLLRSGIGPAADLAAAGIDVVHDLPSVGANLADHVGPGLVYRLPGHEVLEGSPAKVVWVGPDASGEQAGFHVLACPMASSPETGTLVHCYVFPLAPRARGRARLDPDDPTGPLRLELPFLTEPDDLADLDLALAAVDAWEHTDAVAAAGIERIGSPGSLTDPTVRDELLQHSVFSYFHLVGTCTMGPDPTTSVVDPSLRVHGIDGLRVADASIMPTIPRANTYLSCVMIAEHLATMM